MINRLILLLLFAGMIALQVFLSGKENKYLGLILPAIMVLGYLIFSLVLLGIYFVCRYKVNNKKDIDKMNIEGLD